MRYINPRFTYLLTYCMHANGQYTLYLGLLHIVLCQPHKFLARDSMLSALYAIANQSVLASVRRPSHGWISGKRLKL